MFFSGMLFLFIVLPLVELMLLLEVGETIGATYTILLVIFTGVVGAMLARWQGLQILFRIQGDLAEGRMPAPYLLDGLLIIIAGALLITPGLITDTMGFLLLVPAFRNVLKGLVRTYIERKLRVDAIDVTYWE